MDPLAALASAGGGVLSFIGQQQANRQNLMMSSGQWKGQQISDEAKTLGVSPLALLGGNTGSAIPMQNAAGDAASVGQNIGRAISAGDPAQDRLTRLQLEHQELVNSGLAMDIAARQAKLSHDAVRAQAGTGPAIPLPVADPRYTSSVEPGLTRFVGREGLYVDRSKTAAEAAFSGDPVSMVRNVLSNVQSLDPSLPPSVLFDRGGSWLSDYLMRPDVARAAVNAGSMMP